MKLSEVLLQLAHGELSQLAMGELTFDELKEERLPALLDSINLGLTALHRRFNLREEQLTFPLSQDGNVYRISSPDLIKIERVYTSAGKEFPLNLSGDPYSCFTPRIDTLRIPMDVVMQSQDVPDKYKTSEVLIVYRANHPKLEAVKGVINPDVLEVDIPYSHLEALLYFVASRVHNPVGLTNEFNAGAYWGNKYEAECMRLEKENVRIDEGAVNERLIRNGWV